MCPAPAIRLATVLALLVGCSGDFTAKPIYNHANGRVVVELSDDIDGRTLYVRARRGSFGTLDCAKLRDEVEPVAGASGTRIDGPVVDPALTKPFYGPEWAGNPTPEMLAAAAMGTDSIIDVCIFDGGDVDAKVERDLFEAWDDGRKEGIGGKADDANTGEVTINSAQEYGERCVAELGEIPFFDKSGDGTYSTYDCLESTPIPMTITHADGSVDAPQAGTVDKCDNPQYIYSLCEAGPRVATRTNDKGTRWVLLCRKSIGGFTSNQFNDIAMIGHNPFTGKTCFFQNALYQKTSRRTCGAACTAASAPASSATAATTPIRSSTARGSTARRTRSSGRSCPRWASIRTSRSARTTRRTRSSTSLASTGGRSSS
jgi:hypothetical protein